MLPVETSAAKQRQGKRNDLVESFHDVASPQKTRDKIGAFAGVSGRTVLLPRQACHGVGDDCHGGQRRRKPEPLRPLGAGLVHFPLAFSPSSTRRRIASGRVATPCFSRHSSIGDSSLSCQRIPICVPRPVVGGRPRFFFGVPPIDLLMKMGYHKSKPGEVSPSAPALTLSKDHPNHAQSYFAS
jgi:hypothetical protein